MGGAVVESFPMPGFGKPAFSVLKKWCAWLLRAQERRLCKRRTAGLKGSLQSSRSSSCFAMCCGNALIPREMVLLASRRGLILDFCYPESTSTRFQLPGEGAFGEAFSIMPLSRCLNSCRLIRLQDTCEVLEARRGQFD